MKSRLSASDAMKVRISRRFKVISIHMVVSADEDILHSKFDSNEDDDSQVEDAIGEMLLDKNSDKIEEYYNRYKNKPPKATSQMWFLYRLLSWSTMKETSSSPTSVMSFPFGKYSRRGCRDLCIRPRWWPWRLVL